MYPQYPSLKTTSIPKMDQEVYPLVYPERPQSRSFFYALGLVFPIAIVTPGCFAFTLYYIISTSINPTRSNALHPAKLIFLIYSLIEIAFFFYLKLLGWKIQRPGKGSEVDPEECMALFHRMMQSGLGEPGGHTKGGEVVVGDDGKDSVDKSNDKAETEDQNTIQDVTGYNLRSRRRSIVTTAASPSTPTTPTVLSPRPRKASSKTSLRPSSPGAVQISRDGSSSEARAIENGASIVGHATDPTSGSTHPSSNTPSSAPPQPQIQAQTQFQPHQSLKIPVTNLPSRTSSPDVTVERLRRDDPRAIEFRERLRNWFDRVPFSSLTRTDILTWLCFACFNLPYESIDDEADSEKKMEMISLLEKSVGLLEKRIGVRFDEDGKQIEDDDEKEEMEKEKDEGFSLGGPTRTSKAKRRTEIRKEATAKQAVKVMRLTLDPVNCMTRPLLIYLFAALINWWLKVIVYRKLGVKVYKQGEMEYLLRIPKDWTVGMGKEERAPIVYLHGLGFGLLQNHFVINSLLTRMQTHPILIPLQPNISMDFFSHRHLDPLSRHDTVESIVLACERWGFWVRDQPATSAAGEISNAREKEDPHSGGVVLMSHSNGSVSHTWILKDHPNFVRRSAFVDPITFCLWEGSLCYNFCYRRPRTGMELLIYYYIASEIGIANTIQRHFDWAANSLFCEQIPDVANEEKNAFFLGGKDVIVDAYRVQKYLHRHGIVDGVHMDPEAGHGEGLAGPALDRLIHWLATGKLDEHSFGEPRSSFVLSAPDTPSKSGFTRKEMYRSVSHAETVQEPDMPPVTAMLSHAEAGKAGATSPDRDPGVNVVASAKLDAAASASLIPFVGSSSPRTLTSSEPTTSSGKRRRFIAERERRPDKVHLVLISTGSVASIKIPLIWRALMDDGRFLVQIIATTPSLQFYDADAIRAESAGSGTNVWTDTDDVGSWEKKGDPILHIELRRWADVVFVAPCSANTIAKISGGLCDNLATSFLRALTPQTPTYIFPAMNTYMYQHPLTAKQLRIIEEDIGYKVVGPMGRKELACGDTGPGAMTEWTEIVQLAKDLVPSLMSARIGTNGQ